MQKKLFCLLLASSMLTPSFSVLANEKLEEVMNESNSEDQFKAFQEDKSLETEEVLQIWIRYQEDGKTLKMEAPIQLSKSYYDNNKPNSTTPIKNSDFLLYTCMLKCIPYGYDLVQSKTSIETTPWSTLETVTDEMKSDRDAVLKDLEDEVRNELPKVEDGDLCWTISLKKWEENRTTAQTIDSTLPVFLNVVTQIGDDGNGTTWWSSTTVFVNQAQNLNLDSSETERLTTLNKILSDYSYRFTMNKPIAKSDLVEVKAENDVVAYTSKSEYIDQDAQPFSFENFGGGAQDSDHTSKTPLTDAKVTVEDVTVGLSATDTDYIPANITVTVKDKENPNRDVTVDPANYNVVTSGVTKEIGTKGTIQVTGIGDSFDGTSPKTTGSYTLYGKLEEATITTSVLTVPTTANANTVKAALWAADSLAIKFGDVELTKDIDYKIDESSITFDAEAKTVTFSIQEPSTPTKVKGTKKNITIPVEEPKEVDLTGASGSVTYNPDGTFKTLTITPVTGSPITIQANAGGLIPGITLNPEKLSFENSTVIPQAITVTGDESLVIDTNTIYKNNFVISVNDVTPAENTPEGPGEEDPNEEKNPFAVHFVTRTEDGTTTQLFGDLIVLAADATGMTVDEQIARLPQGYSFVGKPKELTITDFKGTAHKNGQDYPVAHIEIIKTPVNVQWSADKAATATVTTKDNNDKVGTLKLENNFITSNGKISKTAIEAKLVGYKLSVTEDVSVDAGDVIGYLDVDGKTYKGLIFAPKEPVAIVKGELKATDEVTITIGEGDSAITFRVAAHNVANTGTEVNSGELNNTKIATYLTNRDKNRVVVNGVANNPPAYTYLAQGLTPTDKEIDPSGKAKVEEDSIKIQIEGASSIRLLIPKVKENLDVSSIVRANGENLESSEEETTDAVALIVQMSNIDKLPVNKDGSHGDKSISATEISDYINNTADLKDEKGVSVNKNELDVPTEDKMKPINLGTPQSLSGIVDNYFQVEVKSNNDFGTGEGDKPAATPSRPSSSKPKPEEPATQPTVGKPTTMYRLYNRLTGEHLYTTNKAERDQLLTSDTWKDEGQGWVAPDVSDYPVYRLLNPNTGDHHYTTDENEYTTLQTLGWIGENIAFYSADKDDTENVILHRLYNPNAQETGMHHYTTDENERDTLVSQGWTYEGTAWAGLKN